ncbi:MAG: HyaD/HybD family hydrogenase maturation endopeptidase [Steroidobacteraceae bacterium]
MDTSDAAGRVVRVLGVGNLLWADEGFGPRCVEALGAGWSFPPEVELIDGGTLGLALIPLLQEATHVLLFDAVDHSGEPGSLVVARDEEVPRFMARDKMSLHQASMNDVLAALEMLGHKPSAFTIVGVKPVELGDYGGSLTPPVREQLPRALEIGLAELRSWGVEPVARAPGDAGVMADPLALGRYESERPAESDARRDGDERFLAIAGGRDTDRPSGEGR